MRLSGVLSSSVALLAAPAWAQDQASPTTANAAVAGQTSTTADQAGDTQELSAGDIVVTATRRSERLSNVPIAVSAVSQEALQNSGATDIRQMTQLAPSLNVSSTGSEANASARIRGVGTVGDNPGLESSVAVFIDGVYRSRTGSALTDLGEVDRIEVLRGPQGTLSGRNSSAGAINIYTKAPSNDFGGFVEGSYGNYNAYRIAGAVTGPLIKDLLSFRVDGVFNKRDGFYDVVNPNGTSGGEFNDRDRYLVRGQLLFEPSADLSIRLIGDYSYKDEKCCGAVYIETREKLDPTPGVPGDSTINPAGNRIVDVINQVAAAKGYAAGTTFPNGATAYTQDPYRRNMAVSNGLNVSNETKDYGGSGQIDWHLGGVNLTSITAYREYRAEGAGDNDYSVLDLVSRPKDGNNFRKFKTFTQEVRLNGELFDDHLDWLVGGYYSHEDLKVVDNLKFGADYGAFASCRAVATISGTLPRSPGSSGCLNNTAAVVPVAPGVVVTPRTALQLGLTQQIGATSAATVLRGLDNLYTLNNLGSVRDVYNQTSENYAFFTHNIFKLTDTLSLTGGLRWTHEKKNFDANFNNNNTVCATQFNPATGVSSLLVPAVGLTAAQNATRATLAANLLTLSCTGNSSSLLSGKTIADNKSESEFTGTAVVSWKPIRELLVYASYSRGYKAGGYNLDRSDLGAAYLPTTVAAANASLLRFDPETVNAYEAGFKLSTRKFSLNLAAFRSDFKNFQLNTFNGTNYIVQNIDSCKDDLNGADQDGSAATGACTGKTGTGMRSQGVEVEAGFYPARSLAVNLGYTFADTKYRNNLVGSDKGEALDPALFLLPGQQISNAPRNVITSSVSWTPELGSSGMHALFYVDQRTASDYNTGSDLFYEKEQDGYTVVNARVGLRGADNRWAVEVWAQNLLDTDYTQIGFSAPFQGSGSRAQTELLGTSPANQLFSAFLAEPRTYGVTVRGRF